MFIKAILFDADGVIIHPWRFARYLEREHGISADMTAPFFRGVFLECIVGRADLKQVIAPFLPTWGWHTGVDAFIERWMAEEDASDPRMLADVARLRAAGFACYLATNQERYRVAYMREQMRFGSLFDGVFASSEIGAMKPDPAYFEAVTARLALPPASILFWDDSAGNVAQAQVHGWHAEHFTTYEAYEQTMRELDLRHG